MTQQTSLPTYLHAAYNWTNAAGEVNEFRGLRGRELTRYITDSTSNYQNDGCDSAPVTSSDLRDLHVWLLRH